MGHICQKQDHLCVCVCVPACPHQQVRPQPLKAHQCTDCERFSQQPPTLPPGHKASGKSCFLGRSIRAGRISGGLWRSRIKLRSQATVLDPPPACIQINNRNVAGFSIKVSSSIFSLETEQSCTKEYVNVLHVSIRAKIIIVCSKSCRLPVAGWAALQTIHYSFISIYKSQL